MNRLQIYPTSRALRNVSQILRYQEGFAPSLMRMDEFEKRAVLIEGAQLVDPFYRVLLLREAARFEAFDALKIDRALLRFFTKSEAIFKFFEEIAAEEVGLAQLAEADAYAEFETHIEVLAQLRTRYRELLASRGLTDRMFLPESYRLNESFVRSYEVIEIFLEGYLSRFELGLLQQISEHTQVIVHYHTTPFTKKMQERFKAYRITLPDNSTLSFDLGSGKVLTQEPMHFAPDIEVLRTQEREEQVALALWKIEEMVRSGIAPEQIVLILPDESFKEHLMLFDRWHNLNFAMGYDYANGRIYKLLELLQSYWQRFESDALARMERYGMEVEKLGEIDPSKEVEIDAFFEMLAQYVLIEKEPSERIEELRYRFERLFAKERQSLRTWLFLWLKALSALTLDDVRGGRVTVMGVLETRGVSFEGVVIVDFNDTVVPAATSKDLFLNSSVRRFAGLPTKSDREALQKHYYYRLLQAAKRSVIIYATAENRLPSKFLYELGLPEAKQLKTPLHLLYDEPVQLCAQEDPVVRDFDASAQVWSASRLKTFLECKRKYYYRYLCDIQAKQDEVLNEGAFLHKVLEHLYKERDHYDDEAVLTRTLHTLIETLLPDQSAPMRYKKALWREKLRGFVRREIDHFGSGWRVVQREQEVHGEIAGLRFKGRIDRIDQKEGETLVLDYKSGKVDKEPKTFNPEKATDFQMSIYETLLESHCGDLSLAYVKILEEGERQQVTHLKERREALLEHIAALQKTTGFVASQCELLQQCIYCEFALLCGRGEYL